MSEEIFKSIPGWPEYQVGSRGTVVRVAASCGAQPGKALRPTLLKNGYLKVSLCRNSKRKEFLVHRLVAMAFIGDPEGFDVCHFDGDKANNSVQNLRIDTRTGNMADQIRMGKTPRGEKCGSNKYPREFVLSLRNRIDAGESVREISAETGVPVSTLYGFRSRQTWFWLRGDERV